MDHNYGRQQLFNGSNTCKSPLAKTQISLNRHSGKTFAHACRLDENKDGGKWRNVKETWRKTREFCLTLVAMQSGSQIRCF